MTNDEINQIIHKFMGNPCVHGDRYKSPPRFPTCQVCGLLPINPDDTATPDYCSSDSPRKLLNEVIERVGISRVYFNLLNKAVEEHPKKLRDNTNIYIPFGASTEDIAREVVDSIEQLKKQGETDG